MDSLGFRAAYNMKAENRPSGDLGRAFRGKAHSTNLMRGPGDDYRIAETFPFTKKGLLLCHWYSGLTHLACSGWWFFGTLHHSCRTMGRLVGGKSLKFH
jgi:hypothetical protein